MTCTCGYKTGACIGTSECEKHYAKNPCYQPKGGMCAVCVDANNDCSDFKWENMPVHSKNKYVVIIICTKFKKR